MPGTMCLVSISLVFANQLLMYFKMLQIPLNHETIIPCSVWRYLLFLLLLQESCIAQVIEPIIKTVDRAAGGVWHLDLVLRGCPPPFSSSHSGLKLALLSNTVWELLTPTACQHRAYSAKYWFNHQKAWKCVGKLNTALPCLEYIDFVFTGDWQLQRGWDCSDYSFTSVSGFLKLAFCWYVFLKSYKTTLVLCQPILFFLTSFRDILCK